MAGPQWKKLEDRVGLVTGAGSGIGRATAVLLAEHGAFVGVLDRDADGGAESVELIRGAGGEAEFLPCDVTDSAGVAAAVDRVAGRRGRLDFAVNNAGIASGPDPIDVVSEADWDRVIAVNLKGVWLCMRHELAHMRRRQSGAIVNMASVCGLVVSPGTSPYNAAKHGVLGLTKEAAVDLGPLGVRVNAVCPGYVQTPLVDAVPTEVWATMTGDTPARRAADPAEIARAVLWLLSDDASYVNGHSLVVDGGLIPNMHRRLEGDSPLSQ